MGKFRFFSQQEARAVADAIARAESKTSGEIRVYVERFCKEDVLDRAAWLFGRLGMHKTRQRTGVLVYVAVESRKLAVIGDAGINASVPAGFWEEVKDLIVAGLKEGKMSQGLVAGVERLGEILQEKFPPEAGDRNELPDEVVFGE